jgi:hypothetical protein
MAYRVDLQEDPGVADAPDDCRSEQCQHQSRQLKSLAMRDIAHRVVRVTVGS